jgi:cytochrome c oxidase cbb3-type subunit III
MKRLFIILLMVVSSVATFAQNVTRQKSFWDDPINDPMTSLYVVIAFVFIVIILVGFVAIYVFRIMNMLIEETERARAAELGMIYVAKPSWLSRFSQVMNASVPVEQEKNIELDHNFDGIKELDNHLPPWWKWLFYGTIGWSAVYLFVFHISNTLPLAADEYEHEVAIAEDRARQLRGSQPQAEVDENSLAFSVDSVTLIANGQKVFADNNCGSCHRNDGGGNTIGPNLTDKYWLHGGGVQNVFHTIKNGVVDKGMPAWGKSLSPQQVRDVAFFILSLQGSNPANSKSPQGNLYQEAEIKSDSTKAQASL